MQNDLQMYTGELGTIPQTKIERFKEATVSIPYMFINVQHPTSNIPCSILGLVYHLRGSSSRFTLNTPHSHHSEFPETDLHVEQCLELPRAVKMLTQAIQKV